MYALAVMQIEGRTSSGDVEAGRDWTEKAAALGHPPAQHALGLLHAGAAGDLPDWDKAVRWFRAAAEQGFAAAEYHLGVLYAEGRGVKKDTSSRPASGPSAPPSRAMAMPFWTMASWCIAAKGCRRTRPSGHSG
jgi:TPR repeat protein